jgi:phosphatidylserine decarboxylase
MQFRQLIQQLLSQEDLNFLLTNRIPRNLVTQFIGWFSKIEQPLVRYFSINIWKFFSDLDLSEAKKTHFSSMHDCFIRELKEGLRPINNDQDVLSSPCDAIVGAYGPIHGTEIFQAKGFPYTLKDLLGDNADSKEWQDGYFVTLRLTSSMYHRFHAPYNCLVDQVTYFSGDTWNVNPIALKRVEKLFCKNERAYLRTHFIGDSPFSGKKMALVPVAAILVASIKLHFMEKLLHLKYRGPNVIACDAKFIKGQEMGWFQHGSTIILIVPKGFTLCNSLFEGSRIYMGQALMRWAE